MATDTQQIVNRACNFAHVVRDDGLSCMGYTEQITSLLFLKMADELTMPPYNREPIVPDEYGWQSLLKRDGDELLDHYRHTLEQLGQQGGMLGEVFKRARPEVPNPAILRRLIVERIDTVEWMKMEADVRGDTDEGLLARSAEERPEGAGQCFTNRAVSQAPSVTRRTFLQTSLATAALSRMAAGQTTPQRPNVVLVMADDQGWGEVGYYGHPQLQTPVLDEVAAAGLRFDRFYSASPVCSPTRASVLTGRHANRSGAFAPNWCTRPEEITIGHVLQAAGYRTGHFGKWHVGAVKAESPVNPRAMGFEEYLSHDNFFENNPPLSRNGAPPEIIQGESSAIVVDAAIDFIKRVHSEGQPFFTIVWFGSPHAPYSGLPEDLETYAGIEHEATRHRFCEITAMDRAIGTLRQALDDLGVRDDTLLWYCSDNGIGHNPQQSFNGGWREMKGSIYDGGLRVPAILEWPKHIKAPRVTNVPCVTSDMFPTILDLLGLTSPDPARPIDGVSLRHLIVDDTMTERPQPIGFWKYAANNEKQNGRWMDAELTRGTTPTTKNPAIDFVNYKHPNPRTEKFGGQAAWLENRYKLVALGPDKAPVFELYDLIEDPREEHELAAAQPERVKAMTAALHAWQASVEQSLSGADYH